MSVENYIMKEVNNFVKSKNGQKYIKDNYGIDLKGKKIIEEKTYINKAYQMKDILYKHIKKVISSIDYNDIIVENSIVEGNRISITLSFREGSLARESLSPVSEDLNDIVMLFTKGYHARCYVYGNWHDHYTKSIKDRQPNDFLSMAVKEFNNKNKGKIEAILDEKYI